MFTSLMMTRRFAPLFWCQFFSAFNDNFLKNALVFLILFQIGGANSGVADHARRRGLHRAVLLPVRARRRDRRPLSTRRWSRSGSSSSRSASPRSRSPALHSIRCSLLFVALFLFGVIASLFGPIKYGILPDHLAREELPAGNALVEGATFIAILLGTIVGGIAAKGGGDPSFFAWLMIVFCARRAGSRACSSRGPAQGAPDLAIDRNILASTGSLLKHLRADPRLWWGALVTSWFWLVGAVALSLLPPLVKNVLGGTEEVVTALPRDLLDRDRDRLRPRRLACRRPHHPAADAARRACCSASSRSISAGPPTASCTPSRAAGRRRRSPLGGGIRIAIDLAGLAIAGGLFIVPTFAAVQAWAGADRRARVIAAVNVLNAAFMVGGTRGVRRCCRRSASSAPTLLHAARRRQSSGRGRHRPHHAGERAQRLPVDHLPRVLSGSRSRASRISTRPAPTPSSRSTM